MRGPSKLLMHGKAVWACLLLLALALGLAACNNNPWPHDAAASNTLHTAVQES